MASDAPGGTFRLADDLVLSRIGYGAMQLAGPGVMGPPRDRDAAVAVLRAAVAAGVTHIDTSDYYGPVTTNEVIREALHPYPESLHLVTKVGATRSPDGGWPSALGRAELVAAVHGNLEHLGLEALDVVNLRVGGAMGPRRGSVAEPFTVLLELQQEGLIRHVGVSNVTADQLAEAQSLGELVCVQNQYNLAHRGDDPLVDSCASQGIAYVPFFPLGGFSPLQSAVLDDVAAALGASPMQVALAWLLQRSPNILLIPGTSSVAHLRSNVAAGALRLPASAVAELDAMGRPAAA
ncbi:oxidoreductase [Amnibacterium sp.]|uniref:oxidoreductase n=1 Tax=Amnibacterium sp. TaxID=1872496 RepID=UPI002609F2FD|nr:oxidoreductase [Amnibacterium sp.]MCU1472103.1 oxidoreductase [Amnibacterium sp.]